MSVNRTFLSFIAAFIVITPYLVMGVMLAGLPVNRVHAEPLPCWPDQDMDGFGDMGQQSFIPLDGVCDLDAGESENNLDCNDSDDGIFPGATEVIGDNVDQNCDGKEICYRDTDNDGYRTSDTVLSFNENCTDLGEAVVGAGFDCNDVIASINPGATEIWYDGVDQSCDAKNDYDQDFDSYVSELFPGKGGGTAPNEGDCLDTDNMVYPGASDSLGDGIDQNCDGVDGIEEVIHSDGFESLDVAIISPNENSVLDQTDDANPAPGFQVSITFTTSIEMVSWLLTSQSSCDGAYSNCGEIMIMAEGEVTNPGGIEPETLITIPLDAETSYH